MTKSDVVCSGVLIDTNGLMLAGQFHIDIFSELNKLGYIYFFVFRSVLFELKKIINKNRRNKKNALIALKLVEKCTIIERFGYVDDLLFRISIE